MSPTDFAAILARADEKPYDIEQAKAIVAAVNLAPLLLDLWRAAASKDMERRYTAGYTMTVGDEALRAALAALEAATP